MEEKIINEIKNNNFSNIKELIKMYSPLGFRILLNFTGSLTEAEEILQDIWVNIYDKIASIKDPKKFKYWFLKVIYNRIKNYKFKKNEKLSENIPYEDNNLYLDKDIEKKIVKIIKEMDIKYQMPIILFYFENLTYKEISQALNKNINTIKSLIKRGKEIIKKKLIKEGIRWKD